MSPKKKAELQEKGELPQPAPKAETPVVGVQAVAARLERSMRTVSNWKMVFDDFPVSTDAYTGVWTSSEEAIDRWKAIHADLYVLHKAKIAESGEKRRQIRRW